jgi:hypothetical protein
MTNTALLTALVGQTFDGFTVTHVRGTYDVPEVFVEPVVVEDNYGERVEVTGFSGNGRTWYDVTGFKFKKNGERAARIYHSLSVTPPVAIRQAMDAWYE